MIGMNRVNVECFTIRISCDKSSVKRAFEMQNIAPDIESQNVGNHIRQIFQFRQYVFRLFSGCFRFIFPANDMCQHKFYIRFAPFSRNFVAISKHFLKFRHDRQTARRFVRKYTSAVRIRFHRAKSLPYSCGIIICSCRHF